MRRSCARLSKVNLPLNQCPGTLRAGFPSSNDRPSSLLARRWRQPPLAVATRVPHEHHLGLPPGLQSALAIDVHQAHGLRQHSAGRGHKGIA